MKQRNSKTYWLVFVGVVLLLAVIVFCIWLPYKNKTKAPNSNRNLNVNNNSNSFDQKDNSNNSNTSNTNLNTNIDKKDTNQNVNVNTNTNPSQGADYYYSQGLTYTSQKQYDMAINSFSKAIEINSKQPDYYSKKAEAEVLAGRKQDAINTVKAGLVANPNDTNLQNKLNVLETVVQ